MITVYTFGPEYELADLSPFVTKLLTYLRMAGIQHRTATGDVLKAPKKKLPYIDDGGVLVADSTHIIEHLQAKGAGEKLPGDALGPREAAIAAAFKAMLESELYFVILHTRWLDDGDFAMYRPVLQRFLEASGIPGAVAPLLVRALRRQTQAQLYFQGMGRHRRDEVIAMGRRHLGAVADHLGDSPYFMGDQPGTIDAVVFAFVDAILGAPFCAPLRDAARAHENLVAYHDRMRQKYW